MLVQKARAHFKLLLLEVGIGKLQAKKTKKKTLRPNFQTLLSTKLYNCLATDS
jgi:hypothetical protein